MSMQLFPLSKSYFIFRVLKSIHKCIPGIFPLPAHLPVSMQTPGPAQTYFLLQSENKLRSINVVLS